MGDDLLFGDSGDDQVHVGFGSDSGFGGIGDDALVSIQSTRVAYLRGDEGNDSLLGGTGFDLNGNMGNNTVTGGYGDDWVFGGKDNDLINGAWGHDIVYGNMGDDTCYGGDMNDTLRGGQGNDLLFGENGNDWIWGDRGDDTISGSGGADTFIVFSGSGLDRVVDYNATTGDRVRVEFGAHTVRQDGADTVVDLGAGDSLVLVGVQLSTLPDGWLLAS